MHLCFFALAVYLNRIMYFSINFMFISYNMMIGIIINDLQRDMKGAAARLDFERAADLRNKLYALKGFDK